MIPLWYQAIEEVRSILRDDYKALTDKPIAANLPHGVFRRIDSSMSALTKAPIMLASGRFLLRRPVRSCMQTVGHRRGGQTRGRNGRGCDLRTGMGGRVTMSGMVATQASHSHRGRSGSGCAGCRGGRKDRRAGDWRRRWRSGHHFWPGEVLETIAPVCWRARKIKRHG